MPPLGGLYDEPDTCRSFRRQTQSGNVGESGQTGFFREVSQREVRSLTGCANIYKRLYMVHLDGLGTRLRQLVAALDGAVEQTYRDHGLNFRPRFYPYFHLLLDYKELSVGQFAERLGFTQPAVTQTLTVMHKAGLVARAATKDKRERRYVLTEDAMAMLPSLRAIWTATDRAAGALEKSLPMPLRATIDAAIAQLEREPFGRLIGKELGR